MVSDNTKIGTGLLAMVRRQFSWTTNNVVRKSTNSHLFCTVV